MGSAKLFGGDAALERATWAGMVHVSAECLPCMHTLHRTARNLETACREKLSSANAGALESQGIAACGLGLCLIEEPQKFSIDVKRFGDSSDAVPLPWLVSSRYLHVARFYNGAARYLTTAQVACCTSFSTQVFTRGRTVSETLCDTANFHSGSLTHHRSSHFCPR
jgi:hypothetical protein